jgi:superfamily II DNA helicase RecQ
METRKNPLASIPHVAAKNLAQRNLVCVLRAADDLRGRGGPELLARVLKGEASSRLRKMGLEECPVYGIFAHMDMPQILARINLAMMEGYLKFDQVGDRFYVTLTEDGREVELDTLANEIIYEFDEILASNQPIDLSDLILLDRQTLDRVLSRLESNCDPKYIPILENWEIYENRKMRNRIDRLIEKLKNLSKGD